MVRLVFRIPRQAGILIKAMVKPGHQWKTHKYIRRLGTPGHYDYLYKELATDRYFVGKRPVSKEDLKKRKLGIHIPGYKKTDEPAPEFHLPGAKDQWKNKRKEKKMPFVKDLPGGTEKELGWKVNKLTPKKIEKMQSNVESRNKFIKENQGFVANEVRDIHKYFGDVTDPMQDANEGFIEAINRFNLKDYGHEGFQQYVRNYIRGYVFHKIRTDVKDQLESINRAVGGAGEGSGEGGDMKEVDLANAIPSSAEGKSGRGVGYNYRDISEAEFRHTVGLIGRKIKHKEARKVLGYLVMGYNKNDIAKIMHVPRGTVTKWVDQHIKKLAKRYLAKSERFQDLLRRIMEE